MFSVEIEENFCPYCFTGETIPDFEPVKVPRNLIPLGGVCSVSQTREEPCQHPSSKNKCRTRKFNDFCERSWAQNSSPAPIPAE